MKYATFCKLSLRLLEDKEGLKAFIKDLPMYEINKLRKQGYWVKVTTVGFGYDEEDFIKELITMRTIADAFAIPRFIKNQILYKQPLKKERYVNRKSKGTRYTFN